MIQKYQYLGSGGGEQIATRHASTECFRVWGAGFGVQGAGCRVQGAGCRVQGAGFRVCMALEPPRLQTTLRLAGAKTVPHWLWLDQTLNPEHLY